MSSPSRIVGEPLQTLKWPDGSRVLLKPLVVEALGYRIRIEADEDFKTDFSSIPAFGRWVVRWSKVDVAGVVHDWLYQSVGRGSVSTELHKGRICAAASLDRKRTRSGDSLPFPETIARVESEPAFAGWHSVSLPGPYGTPTIARMGDGLSGP